jgi:hypothetical protein
VEGRDDVQQSPGVRGRLSVSAAHVGGWAGLGLGLVNVYPTLFPWTSPADKGVGVLVCLLITAVVARMAVLAGRSQLDWPLVALVAVLILIAAVVIVLSTDRAADRSNRGQPGSLRPVPAAVSPGRSGPG